MRIELNTLVEDFAACLKRVDSTHPQAINIRSKEAFQPGIGPHSEAQTVKLITDEMQQYKPSLYKNRLSTNISYPESPRQKCDLCVGNAPLWEWAVEIKMLRFLGDNGKLNDNILMHILSPYPEHHSALTDCRKLLQSSLGKSKAVLIYGFNHHEWPLEPAVEAFEILARAKVGLGQRHSVAFEDLVHPIHAEGKVFGWELCDGKPSV